MLHEFGIIWITTIADDLQKNQQEISSHCWLITVLQSRLWSAHEADNTSGATCDYPKSQTYFCDVIEVHLNSEVFWMVQVEVHTRHSFDPCHTFGIRNDKPANDFWAEPGMARFIRLGAVPWGDKSTRWKGIIQDPWGWIHGIRGCRRRRRRLGAMFHFWRWQYCFLLALLRNGSPRGVATAPIELWWKRVRYSSSHLMIALYVFTLSNCLQANSSSWATGNQPITSLNIIPTYDSIISAPY